MKLVLLSLLGLALFCWPLLGGDLPADTAAAAVALAALGALLLLEVGFRHLDARRVALLAALAALDTAFRLVIPSAAGGFSPIFFLVLLAGFVFGPAYGFLLGGFTVLVSSLAEGAVGPWVPYQIFATGWVGVSAGVAGLLLPGGWRQRRWLALILLAAVGALSGWAYGAFMDIQVWVAYYRGPGQLGWMPGMARGEALVHYGRFYLLTSLAYDTFRAFGNALMVMVLGVPVLLALRRVQGRLKFEIVENDAAF